MLASSRFAAAVHALVVLTKDGERGPVCSSYVASSLSTNPVVIRRLMIDLEKAALVTSASGRSGGFSLSRTPSEITLADIYRAVEDEGLFRPHRIDPKTKCPVGIQILKVLSQPFEMAEEALTGSLSRTSLQEVAARIQ
jgi:Rrf2 family protein